MRDEFGDGAYWDDYGRRSRIAPDLLHTVPNEDAMSWRMTLACIHDLPVTYNCPPEELLD